MNSFQFGCFIERFLNQAVDLVAIVIDRRIDIRATRDLMCNLFVYDIAVAIAAGVFETDIRQIAVRGKQFIDSLRTSTGS